jgi:hypothetical protein
MTPPTWLDAAGRRRQLQIPEWCGCSTEYLPVPVGDGWWSLVPIWEPDVTPNLLRHWVPPVPYWAADLYERANGRGGASAGADPLAQ